MIKLQEKNLLPFLFIINILKDLYKIFETNEFFYLYLDSRHSLILDKSGFTKGTPTEFKDFIKKKCPLKYRYDKVKTTKL